MPNQFEIELAAQLTSGVKTSEIVDESLTELHEGSFSIADKKAIMVFAMNAGYTKSIVRILREWPSKEKYFPWDMFFSILVRAQETLSDQEMNAIFSYLQIKNSRFFISPTFAEINDQFKPKISEFRDSLAYESDKKIRLLWEKLNFVQERQLLEEEQKILEEIKIYDGKNPKLQKHLNNLSKKLAENIVTKATFTLPEETQQEIVEKPTLEPQEIELCRLMLTEMENNKADGDRSYFDFSIHFYFLEAYSFALTCIQKAPNSDSKKWLELELLFLSTRYFECIDLADRLVMENQDLPDVKFAGLYQKAQALWAIGSPSEAIDIMKAIVNTQPNYRSAHQILHSWTETQRFD